MDSNIRHQLSIIEEFSGPLKAGASILDFGCGAGDQVATLRELGFEAMGCDVGVYSGAEKCRAMYEEGTLKLIVMNPYRLPFDDDTFDVIVSSQVFEHVKDYRSAIREIHRVLKPGGLSLHVFPSRWRPIEAHVLVPIAGALRNSWWLGLWAWLGIRNEFQRNLSPSEVAALNKAFLEEHTNYLSTADIRHEFGSFFSRFNFAEDSFLKHSPSRKARLAYRLNGFVTPISKLYGFFRQRVVVAVKS